MSSLGGTVIDNTEFPKWKARNRQRNELYDAILLSEGEHCSLTHEATLTTRQALRDIFAR